jgi:lipooligosaccharide transport system permease protein
MLTGTFRVWQRNLQVWNRYAISSIVANLGEPILYLVAIGFVLGKFIKMPGDISYMSFFSPALIAISAMNSATFETTISSYTRMQTQKTFHAILATPICVEEIISGEIFWGMTKALMAGFFIILVLGLFGYFESPWVIVIPLVLILSGLMFASIGMVVTSFAHSYDFFSYYFTLVLSPMFLFSGTFFPVESLPQWGQTIAWFLPLTHTVRMVRELFFGSMTNQFIWDGIWTIILTVFMYWIAIFRLKRRLLV